MPSTVIANIIYNEATSALTIVFLSGAIYEYRKVPLRIYNQLQAAPSKGAYLNKYIKGAYSYKKIK